MDVSILKRVGLTDGEAKVYLALLRLGQSLTGPIVKRSSVSTSKVYKILDRLEKKGLASHIYKKKTRLFAAASPEKIADLITKEYKDLEKKKVEVESLVPQLVQYQKEIAEDQQAEIYCGMGGLDTVFGEQVRTLAKGEESFVIGITHAMKYGDKVNSFFERLQAKRDSKKLITNLLYSEEARGTMPFQEISRYCRIRYLPYASEVAINVYKDVTIIGVFVNEPILFKIKSTSVAENFIHYFKLLWKEGKP
ncbi:MAG: helix-turn-helix domain-containing protein [Candidatus Woesearchaeota archaeon]